MKTTIEKLDQSKIDRSSATYRNLQPFAILLAMECALFFLYASKMIMRPGRVTEEHLDPCLGQTDCRYDEGPLRDAEPMPENAYLVRLLYGQN